MLIDLAEGYVARAGLLKVIGHVRASHLGLLYSAAGRGDLPHDVDTELVLDLIIGTMLVHNSRSGRVDFRLIGQLTDLIIDGQLRRMTQKALPHPDIRQRRGSVHGLNVNIESKQGAYGG